MIDLNCDMGEGIGNDEAIMPYITSANIACGYHAGNEATIQTTIALCLKYNVKIGAHPGFADKPNFGRVPMYLSDAELYKLIFDQLLIMQNACKDADATLHHVKPHGALYNMAAGNQHMSEIIAQAVHDFNPNLIYYGLSGSIMIAAAQHEGLSTCNEVFSDRTYQPDGTLTPRTHPHALINTVNNAVKQVRQIISTHTVTTLNGSDIHLQADTICIHGDGLHATEIAKALHHEFNYLDTSH